MATIYTNIGDVSPPARTDYFEGVKGAITDYSKKKEDDNQARLDAVAKIPTLSTTQMWDSHFAAAQEMDEDLRDSLDGASESPESMAAWERKLQQRMDFVKEAEAYYGKTAELALKRAVIAGDPSLNPEELSNAGKIDDHGEDHYRSNMDRLDNPGEFAGVTSTEDGFVLGGGINPFDVFSDTEWLNVDLVDLDPQRPEGWWGSHVGKATDISETEATNTIIGAIEQDQREIQNAKVWWSKNANDGEGMPIENVDQRTAVEEYAKEAAKSRIIKKPDTDKKGKGKGRSGEEREISYDNIIRDSTGESLMPNESNTDLEVVDDVAYYPLDNSLDITAATWKGFSDDDDSEFKTKNRKFSLSAIYMTAEEGLVAVDSAGNYIPINKGQIEYKSLSNQFDNAYGKGEFEKLVSELYSNVHESDDRIVNETDWKMDQGLIKSPEEVEEEERRRAAIRKAELTQLQLDRASSYPTGGMK